MGLAGVARRVVRKWLRIPPGTARPAPAPLKPKRARSFSGAALAELSQLGVRGDGMDPWAKPPLPHWVETAPRGGRVVRAMDSLPWDTIQAFAQNSPWSEGLGFMGYGYLAEMWQRPEYRRISEIWAAECTRKWIKLTGGDPERLALIDEQFKRFGVREKFREAIELDGGFGRAHIFMDFGDRKGQRSRPMKITPETIPVDSLRNLKVVEAYWVMPLQFETMDPLINTFYAPQQWSVMGDTVHSDRLLTIVGRELPDLLKPMYLFGGLSLSQMVKPAVDNFIRNRTSVANLLYSFSTMVLSTNMTVMLSPEGAGELINRIQSFIYGRDSGGVMVVDKESEDLKNVSAPLGSIDKLLAQSMEMILIPAGIPMVVYAGQSPTGLNASSEGELKAFYGHVLGYNEKAIGPEINTLLMVLQLNLDGVIDPTVGFEFIDLWELDDEARARIQQLEGITAVNYINAGVLDPEDERTRLENTEGGLWHGMKLKEPPEPLPDDTPLGGSSGGAGAGDDSDQDADA